MIYAVGQAYRRDRLSSVSTRPSCSYGDATLSERDGNWPSTYPPPSLADKRPRVCAIELTHPHGGDQGRVEVAEVHAVP